MIENILLRIKCELNKRKLKHLGKGPNIHYSTRIKNPQYFEMGDCVYIGANCVFEAWDEYNDKKYNPKITIGDGTMFNCFCHLGAINEISIGNDCLFGSHIMIIDHSHGSIIAEENSIHPAKRDLHSKGKIIIGNRVWVGENVVILPSVSIGDEAIIGANAVVTNDVPAGCVAAGNPARVVKRIK